MQPRRRTSYQDKEDATTGMSSEQIWRTFNVLLRNGLQLIFENTTYNQSCLITLICSSIDKRRKVSILPADQCRAVLFYSLVFDDPMTQLDLLLEIGTERNLLSMPVDVSLRAGDLPEEMNSYSTLEKSVIVRNSLELLEAYFEFRRMVISRYDKLAGSLGTKNAWVRGQSGLISDAREHHHNYIMAVARAVDKFYPGKGTLTTYVQSWMENAAGSAHVVYVSEAFSLPRNKRRKAVDNELGVVSFAKPLEAADYVQAESPFTFEMLDVFPLLEQLYSIKELLPALHNIGMPCFLLPSDVQRLRKAGITEHVSLENFYPDEHALMCIADIFKR